MPTSLNKEKILFLVGALLFAWVGAKLAICLAQHPSKRQPPVVPPPAITVGDPNIVGVLASDSLSSYLDRGPRADPFSDGSGQPSAFFARSTVQHTLSPLGVISRYIYDCRMLPTPAKEIRFKLPAGMEATHVFSKELAPRKNFGHDGSTLIVPVVPTQIKRTYYRCQITVELRSYLKATPEGAPWTAPVVMLKGATDSVQAECGDIALLTTSDRYELVLTSAVRKGITDVRDADIPEHLASKYTKGVYHFAQAEYELTVPIKSKGSTGAVVVVPKVIPTVPRPPDPFKGVPVPEPPPPPIPKIDVPPIDDIAETLSVKLVALVKIETPEPRRQAVFRDKKSGEYFRKFEGESVLDMKIDTITDNSVIVTDAAGKRHIIPGRFMDKY